MFKLGCDTTGSKVMKQIEDIFFHFGTVKVLIVDNCTHFTSYEGMISTVKSILRKCGKATNGIQQALAVL